LWEQLAKLTKHIFRNTHEDNIWELLRLVLVLVVRCMSKSLKNEIGLKVIQDLVITEVGVLWQVKDWLLFLDLIVFIVEHFHKTLSNEVHLFDIASVTDDGLSWGVDSAIHTNDQLVGEASFTLFKEVVEGLLELFEHSCVLNQVCLHFGSDLLVELELLNHEVEII
jgi:hypothetical protein